MSGFRCQEKEKQDLKPRSEKGRKMDEKYLRLLEATKALVNHIDTERVFDKAVQMGRGSLGYLSI